MSSTVRCPTCDRTFTNRLALGVHQARARACHDPEAPRRRARERERRYRERHRERRRAQVRASRLRLLERRPDFFRAWRAANVETERARRQRWRMANPELLREQARRRRARQRVDVSPLPPTHTAHPLFDQAWRVLDRLGIRRDDHLATIHDPRWEDACSAVVLALVEGRDGTEAAREVLAVERRHAAKSVRIDDLDRLDAAG